MNNYQYGYNPTFSQYNPYSYQQPIMSIPQQLQNTMSQQQIQQTQTTSQNNQVPLNMLQGWFVDGYDVVKVINADMSGNAMFFPSTDGKEIYKKQLDINTGKSFINVYKLENKESELHNNMDFSPIYNQISDVRNDLSNKISEIKDMVLESITTPKKKVGDE